MSSKRNASGGVSGCAVIGIVLAIVISWGLYHSIMWAAIHGFFGWFYVAYYLLTR